MLFQIHDEEFPMYVMAASWAQAVDKWRGAIAKELELPASTENPAAVIFLAQDDEVIL